jgi:Tfp pilus assembly protein PilZ
LHSKATLRKFIRHPADVPIKIALDWVADDHTLHPCDSLGNVGLGGLAFKSPRALLIGQTVGISFPLLNEHHSLRGKVVWNQKSGQGFEIGLQFDDPDELYQCRMIEQICHIQHYRDQIEQQEGRKLSREQAASEWIARYAKDFPALKHDPK